jgi:ribonuclease D
MTKDVQWWPPPIWVDTQAGFRAMLAHLRGEPALAVDTESNSLYVYEEQVCLIQISVPETDYLVDPLALKDLSGLGPLLVDPAVLKVLHGAEYDLSVLNRDFGFTLANLFDTMWASRILGWPAHGLAALLKSHFGVRLNKKHQRANWGLRPLPPEQLDYARLDTHYLLSLQRIQARELEATNRWPQARHRFAKLTEMRWEPKDFDPDGFWQISGVRDLDDVGRGVLRALYLCREDCAEAQNRPPFKVISNRALLALSGERPQELAGLRQAKGVPSWLVRKYGRRLLAAIRQGEGQPLAWDDRPRFINGNNRASNGRHNGRPSAACQARFEALRIWRNAAAEERGVEPDLVLTNQALWEIAYAKPGNRDELAHDGLLARWQVDEFGKDLLRVIGNKP